MNVEVMFYRSCFVVLLLAIIILWLFFNKYIEKMFKFIFMIYVLLGVKYLVLIFLSWDYSQDLFFMKDLEGYLDPMVLKVVEKYKIWIESKDILDLYTIGFLMLSVFKYLIDLLKELNLKHTKEQNLKHIKQIIKYIKERMPKATCILTGAASCLYLWLIIIDSFLNIEQIKVAAYVGFCANIVFSFIEWFIISPSVERSKSHKRTDKDSNKAFLVDVCGNADIQCIHKSYTIRCHELSS